LSDYPENEFDLPKQLTLNDRLSRYSELKTKQLQIVDEIGNLGLKESADLAMKMATCGNWLTFRDYYTVGEVRLTGACFCKKHLTCQLCAVRRSAKLLQSTLPKFEHLLDSDTKLYPHLIVFTIKSGHDLAERLRHLESSWQKMRRRASMPDRYRNSFLRKTTGGILSIEATHNKKAGWHPHMNLLVLSPCKSFDWQAVKDEWLEITGDSKVVNFSTDAHSLTATIAETIKYVTKINDLSANRLWELQSVFKRRKTVRGFGCLHGLKMPDSLTDDVLADDLPYIEYVCRHLGADGYTIYSALESAASASAA